MCNITAAAIGSFALNAYGEYASQKATAKSAQAEMNARRNSAIQNMTNLFQNYEIERQDAFDAAVADLDKITRNFSETSAQVEAAVNEGYGGTGRTAGLINRAVSGDLARARMSIKDNYARKSNEIDLNKENTYKQTNDYIKGINMSAPKMPSRFQNALTLSGMALGAYTQYANEFEREKNAQFGGKYKTYTGGSSISIGNLGVPSVNYNPTMQYTLGISGSSNKWSNTLKIGNTSVTRNRYRRIR